MAEIAHLLDELTPPPTGGPIELVTRRVLVDMPIELYPRRDADGRLRLDASAPTQAFGTTFMPVLHRLSVRVELAPDALEAP